MSNTSWGRLSCCGVGELDGIEHDKPLEALKGAFISRNWMGGFPKEEYEDPTVAFMLFTGVTKEKYAQRFKAYLLRHKLGEVIETPSRMNPNMPNRIRGGIKAYLWHVDREALRAHLRPHIDSTILPERQGYW
jgi:hypothetical protein